jgi:hypothetical protein
MRRRRLLALLAAVSSGCLRNEGRDETANGTDNSEENTTEENESDAENTEADERWGDGTQKAARVREEMLSSIPPQGSDIVVEFESVGLTAAGYDRVARLAEDGDEDGPPILRTVWVNDGDGNETYELASLPPYDGVAENEDGDILYAVPTEEHELVEETPEVERDDSAWYLNGEYNRDAWLPETVELPPDTGYVGEYAVVSDDGELSEGEYPFGGGTDDPRDDGLTAVTWSTDSPGPSEESRFEGEELPRRTDGERLSFYHDADETTEVYLEPSREMVELPSDDVEEVEFKLVNRSDGTGSPLHASFLLYKLVDDSWVHVTSNLGARPGEFGTVEPGDTATERLHLFHSLEGRERDSGGVAGDYSYIDDLDGDGRGDDFVLGPLGGGVYAHDPSVSIDGYHPAAAFEVDAPRLSVEPPGDASSEREGNLVEVNVEGDDTEDAGFVVRRVEGRDDATTVPPEALYGIDEGLRYAVPFFDDGVEGVQVNTNTRTVDTIFFRTDGTRRFVYDGTVYSAEMK